MYSVFSEKFLETFVVSSLNSRKKKNITKQIPMHKKVNKQKLITKRKKLDGRNIRLYYINTR